MAEWSAFDWGVIVGMLIGAFGTILLYVTDEMFGLVDWIVDKLDDWVDKAEGRDERPGMNEGPWT